MRRCKSLPFAILTLLLAVIFFLPASQLQAGASNKSGNPYGNGTFFPDGGTYTGIIRGANALGVIEFTTASQTSLTNSSSNGLSMCSIYAYGQQYIGDCVGVVSGSAIAGNFSGNVTNNYNGSNNEISGYFNASLYNTYPTQSFSGSGQASGIGVTVGTTNWITETQPISVQGSLLQ